MKNFNNDETTSTINKNFALNYGDYKTFEDDIPTLSKLIGWWF